MNNSAPNMIRDIIEINEELCNGCGQCINGCAEGALALVDGKAKLVSDIYCDGLGACLGHCPTGALKVIKRAAPDFDEEAAMSRVREMQAGSPAEEPRGCPGSRAQLLAPRAAPSSGCPGSRARSLAPAAAPAQAAAGCGLVSWPIQLKLAPPQAPFLDSPVLTLAADCTAFTGPAFHQTFLSEGHPLLIACPKLDDVEYYIEKVTEILKLHPAIKELRLAMMSVPCCGGLNYIAAQAAQRAGRGGEINIRTWILTPQGEVSEENIR